MLRQVLRPVAKISRSATRSYNNAPANYKPPHMNDVVVPQGSWQENYDKLQKSYNMQLAAGVIMLIGTIAFGKATGMLYLNYYPPELPKEDQ